METLLTRTPAHDIATEEALISALLIDNDPFEDILSLKPGDFYKQANGKIYQAMTSLYKTDNPVDLVTVATWLKKSGDLEKIGGAAYLASIADSAPMALNPIAYARTIKDLALNRQVLSVASKIQDAALRGESGEAVLEMLQSEAMKIQTTDHKDNIQNVKDLMDDHLDRIETANTTHEGRGYRTGFPNIDRCLSIRGPKLIVVAGRPKAGKTSLAITIMRNMDSMGIKTGILSIEMPGSEIIDKWIAQESQVDSQKFGKYKGLSPEEFESILNATGSIAEKCKIMIDDSGSIGIEDVKRKCRKMVKAGCKVLFIDQLSQIKGKPGEDRFGRYESNTNQLAILKKELGVPIFLLAQLNRELEKRNNKEPIPSDLKMTGSLEEDSDAVIFVYRPEVYAKDEHEAAALKGKAILNLALNRHGSPWREKVLFRPETSYFYQDVNI
jgi:replicative DNA helicase